MKKLYFATCILLILSISLSANTDNLPSELQEYLQETEVAEMDMNTGKASIYYKKAIDYCREHSRYQSQLPSIILQYSTILTYSGDYSKSIDLLNEAIKENNLHNNPDKLIEARIFMQFGIINFFQENWKDALYYYQKAEKLAIELNNNQGLSIAQNNIANIHQKRGDYQQAIKMYRRCLLLQEHLKDTATICNTYFNIGTCYEELKQPKKAAEYFAKSHLIASSINDIEIVALSLLHQGIISMQEGKEQKAEELMTRAENIVKKSGHKQVLSEIYKSKADAKERLGEYKSALKNYKLHQIILDSIAHENLHIKTQELHLQLQTEEKERAIMLQKIQIKNKNIILIIFIISLAIAIVFIVVLFNLRRRLQQQNEALAKLNATKDRLFSIISHDLKSPSVAQKLAIDSLRHELNTMGNSKALFICDTLQENAHNQVNIIENLMDWAKTQTDRIKYSPQNIDIISTITEEIQLSSIAAQNKSINIITSLPKSSIVFADKQMIAIVIRNLLNNAIKFTQDNNIDISLEDKQTEAIITISDTGIGMRQEQIDAFHRKDSQVEVCFGTKGEKGTGLGLMLCRDLLLANHSELQIKSQEGTGTIMQFILRKKIN